MEENIAKVEECIRLHTDFKAKGNALADGLTDQAEVVGIVITEKGANLQDFLDLALTTEQQAEATLRLIEAGNAVIVCLVDVAKMLGGF